MPQPLEAGDELLIEDCYLTVEDQRGLRRGGNRSRYLAEASCVISPIPTEELHLAISLLSQEPPAAVFLVVDPSLPMEGTGDERGCISVMSEERGTVPVYRGSIGRDER
jgi:hypothetical protein